TFEVVYTTPGATGSLNVKPALNKTGATLVTVTVADDGPGTAPDVNTTTTTFTINITPVNDPPVITAQAVVSVNENNTFTIGLGHVTIEDPDNTSGFTLTVTGPGANYTHSGNTITPAADFYGQLTIPITVSDGTASSAPFNFVLTVNPVNDAPVITGQEPIV